MIIIISVSYRGRGEEDGDTTSSCVFPLLQRDLDNKYKNYVSINIVGHNTIKGDKNLNTT